MKLTLDMGKYCKKPLNVMKMKYVSQSIRAALFGFLLFMDVPGMAQTDVDFHIVDGMSNSTLRVTMERNVSDLLTELNRACQQQRSLRFTGINITTEAQRSLSMLWKSLRFYCEDEQIYERCYTSVNGFQLRNIAIHVVPVISGYDGDLEREITVSLSPNGQITGARMALTSQVYSKILKYGDAVEMSRREEILKFVEDFRSHYDEKDLEALRQVFSDDALIITGSVVMKRDYQGDQPKLRPEIVYRTQNKEQYLSRLNQKFNASKYIKVTFSDPEVVRSGDNPNFYGVSLRQHWKDSSYEDDGYVFLLWEFRENGQPPIVHVRTWQPDKIAGKELPKKQLINILDFEIPAKKK